MEQMRSNYKGKFSEEELIDYWYRDCKVPSAAAASPALQALECSVVHLSIDEWLRSIAKNDALLQYRDNDILMESALDWVTFL